MELFEQIRRDREREGLSIRALAERHGVHRRAVRQALESAVPPAKRPPVGRPAPELGAYRAVIDGWLEADREAPRKQRHTARSGSGSGWSTSTAPRSRSDRSRQLRACAQARELGWPVGEVFVPQVTMPGVEAEVDWGEAKVELAGERDEGALVLDARVLSGAAFCQASVVETQQAFLEGHVAGVRVVRRRVRR